MSGTAAELVPVRRGRRPRDRRAASRARSRACCGAAFDDAIHGRTERYREWLDVVHPRDLETPAGEARAGASELPGRPASAVTPRPVAPTPSAARRASLKGHPNEPRQYRLELYDATLRDGMGGGGMTLTAAGEAARRARPRRARRAHDRGRLPGVEPEGAGAVRAARRRAADERRDRRLRHDPPARDAGRRTTRGCGCSPSPSRRSARSSARPRCCTSRRSCASAREENLAMIADSVAFLVARGQARAARRRALLRRLRARPGLRAGLPARRRRRGRRAARAVRHQRRHAAAADPHRARRRARSAARTRRSASTATTTPAARSPTR